VYQGNGCLGVGWARKDGKITSAFAPGTTGRVASMSTSSTPPAVSKTLRTVVHKTPGIIRKGDLCVVDLLKVDGEVTGAVAWHAGTGAP